MNNDVIVSIQNVSKFFPGVTALDDVNLEIRRNEVHAIIGENGAGKSTLMKVLTGIYQPSKGCVVYNGSVVKFRDTHQAQLSGISMIHQELSLLPRLSIAENIFEGRLPKNKIGLLNYKKLYDDTRAALAKVKLDRLNPRMLISEVNASQQQLIEIAKALSFNSKLIIMDEPTSSLTVAEADTLFGIIDDLKKNGITILYISHKLNEIMRIADTVSVMRDGKLVHTSPVSEMTMEGMISMMVGRQYNLEEIRSDFIKDYDRREKVVSVRNLVYKNKVRDVSFDVYRGEILGISGLVGAGRSEVLQCVFGGDKRTGGEIYINGELCRMKSSKEAIEHGLALVPEGRKQQALFLRLTIRDNATLVFLRNLRNKLGLIDLKKVGSNTVEYIDKLNIKTPSSFQIVDNLSGGNQQKVVLAKWLMNKPLVLFLDEPTQGIDVLAKSEIYHIMVDLAKAGVTIVMVSSEMQETLTLCDRVLVMYEGKIMGELFHEGISEEKIMTLASGHAL